ncbi:DNA internalization-related competence protein ComEC/Rec2 [Levilactobacillus bambusae]|uniref:DNA internalization-related competence protein ComEC/Rec2 n=1 Tax=Levilactobacillus bambusae TaxID=2024736 RepID=UPI001403F3E3|nr:DNA internalization-related competence protein ComEC/Rec2 [Levilactobacillus bambusae]
MIKPNRLIFGAFAMTLVALIWYWQPIIGLVLFGLFVLRLCKLRESQTLLVTVFCAVIMCGVIWHREAVLDQLTLKPVSDETLTIRILPDELRWNGAQFSEIGTLTHQRGRVLLTGRAKNHAEYHRLRTLDRPAEVTVVGQLVKILPPTNVNQFDSQRYFRENGVAQTVKISQLKSIQQLPLSITRPLTLLHWFRMLMINDFNRLPGLLKPYALGLITGTRSNDFNQAMTGIQDLGLIHLFSISGLHVSLMILALEWGLFHLWLPRQTVQIIQLGMLPIYFVIAGGSVGLLRSVLMAGNSLIAKQFGIHLSGLDNWSLALMITLMINPMIVLMMGPQLSFALSFGLIMLHHQSRFFVLLALNLIQLPILLNSLYQWHLLSVVANLIVVPIFGITIMPLTFIGVIAAHCFYPLALLVAVLLSGFETGIRWVSQLPGMIIYGRPPLPILILLVGATTLLLAFPNKWQRLSRLLGMIYLVGFLWIHFPILGEVVFFDVGQGDSFLIRTPFNQQVVMIDTGGKLNLPDPTWAPPTVRQANATRTSLNYLKSQGISRLDGVYLSHQDADHVGDIATVLDTMHVQRLYVPAGMENNRAFCHRLSGHMAQTKLISVRAGQSVGAGLTVIHPFQPGLGSNADSMVLLGRYGGQRFLFMGDLDRAGERQILMRYPAFKADIIKLGHHGSKTSSDPQFLAELQPKLAIISAGRHNRYGHPNEETLVTLARQKIPQFSTQQRGMIWFRYFGQVGIWHVKLKESIP